jgi:hypothetical protein
MHRSSVYEALGMLEHSKLDLQRIIDADPHFIKKFHQLAVKYELEYKFKEAE